MTKYLRYEPPPENGEVLRTPILLHNPAHKFITETCPRMENPQDFKRRPGRFHAQNSRLLRSGITARAAIAK